MSKIPSHLIPFRLKSKLFFGLHSDWALHFIEYAILAVLLYFTLASWSVLNRRSGLWLAGIWAVSGIIGIINELLQNGTPGRTVSFDDLAANLIGSAIALFIIFVAMQRNTGKI
ncbi:MAG: hypothetical protein FJY65_10855 [Calditrichaeota bacterium]|nr:hypothetical protein [Calditrichota bacterium]